MTVNPVPVTSGSIVSIVLLIFNDQFSDKLGFKTIFQAMTIPACEDAEKIKEFFKDLKNTEKKDFRDYFNLGMNVFGFYASTIAGSIAFLFQV